MKFKTGNLGRLSFPILLLLVKMCHSYPILQKRLIALQIFNFTNNTVDESSQGVVLPPTNQAELYNATNNNNIETQDPTSMSYVEYYEYLNNIITEYFRTNTVIVTLTYGDYCDEEQYFAFEHQYIFFRNTIASQESKLTAQWKDFGDYMIILLIIVSVFAGPLLLFTICIIIYHLIKRTISVIHDRHSRRDSPEYSRVYRDITSIMKRYRPGPVVVVEGDPKKCDQIQIEIITPMLDSSKFKPEEMDDVNALKMQTTGCVLCDTAITMESEIIETSCKHFFHYSCLRHMLLRQADCPDCGFDILNFYLDCLRLEQVRNGLVVRESRA